MEEKKQGWVSEFESSNRGLSGAVDMRASSPGLRLMSESETPSGVPWSPPTRGITGDLDGPRLVDLSGG